MTSKTMDQFYTDFLEEIQISVDADLSGWSIEDFFTSIMLASVDKGIHNKTTKYGLPTY